MLCSAILTSAFPRTPKWRLNLTLLKQEDFKTQFTEKLKEFLEFNIDSVDDPRILWDSIKGFIRCNATLFASNQRKARICKLRELECRLAKLESALSTNFSEHIVSQREVVKRDINIILRRQSEFLIHRTRQRYYFHGSRPSHLLAMKISSNEQFSDISSVKLQSGAVTTDPTQINNTFRSFYSDLYKSNTSLNKPKCDIFFWLVWSYLILLWMRRMAWPNRSHSTNLRLCSVCNGANHPGLTAYHQNFMQHFGISLARSFSVLSTFQYRKGLSLGMSI